MSENKDVNMGKKVAINSIAGMASNAIYLVSRLVLTPFILIYIPLEQYGLWSVCFIILSYAGLSAFGVNSAYIKYVAQFHASGDRERINKLLSTGMFFMGASCLIIYSFLWFSIPALMEQFSIAPELREVAIFLILGSSAAFLLDIAFGGFKALLEGMQEIALVRMAWLSSTLVEVALIIFFLMTGLGIRGLLYALIVRYVTSIFFFAFLAFKRASWLRISIARIDRDAFRLLIDFGGKVQALGVIGIFMTTFDRIVTTAIIGLEATGLFEVGRKFPSLGASVSAAAFDAFLPAASHKGVIWEESGQYSLSQKSSKYLKISMASLVIAIAPAIPILAGYWSQDNYKISSVFFPALIASCIFILWPGIPLLLWLKGFFNEAEHMVGEELRDLYLKGCRYINILNATLFFFLIAAADRLLFAWLGDGYSGASSVLIIISISVMVNLWTGPGTSLVRGIERPGREFEYALVNIILALVWIPGFAYLMGLAGAALGTALSTVIASLYFIVRTNRAIKISGKEWFSYTILPLAVPLFSALIVWVILSVFTYESRFATASQIAATGILYLLLTSALLKRHTLTVSEWRFLISPILKVAGR